MQKKITDNIPLKLMSLGIGILVWLMGVNIDNPIIDKQITIQNVELINTDYTEDAGLMCLRDEKQPFIRVTLTGERKLVSKITSDDIQAIADMQQAVSLDTDPVMVPISVSCTGILSNNIEIYPKNLSVHLEEKETQEFIVNVNSGDSRPGKGYEIGTHTVSPEKVRITGPKSLINKIDKVNVNISVEGKTQDTVTEAALTITDKNQDVLSDSSMANLKIDNGGRASVTTRFWKVRSDVKIAAEYTGEPAEGFVVDSVTTIPDTVSVAGSDETLENLKLQGNTILIPAENIDITGMKRDVEEKVKLSEFLPEGLVLTSGSSEDVWVRVNILPEGSKAYTIPTNDIEVRNKPKNLQVTFDIARIEVRVNSEEFDVSDLKPEEIKTYIDLEDKEEGNYEIKVQVELPDGYELVEEVETEVKISKID